MRDILVFIKALLRRFLTQERAEIGMAMCGLVALITPLLLWVAWSPNMLKGILVMGFTSFLLATWFAQYACPEVLDVNEEETPKPEEYLLKEVKRIARDGDSSQKLHEKKTKP